MIFVANLTALKLSSLTK